MLVKIRECEDEGPFSFYVVTPELTEKESPRFEDLDQAMQYVINRYGEEVELKFEV